ncbi:arsenate reductase (azurin) large subunit [Rhodanobacter sp. B2A1Ga4]|uniref:arsenate reductase (azurin) large subunit n=1 Tax=Rhodanobacter sp. B2A1Ga4 TaxID=2778647 RepID=UPI001B37B4FC|nr:arsenate reductase (azurin) large subunit [Rhodanobacter sp. B2A1Ga4]MBQ4855867.1 arsenate reductase (azurin) large subunit [Rhodanobacter sp. B2A1Ga4]
MSQFKDRIALPPANAQKTNMTCHFCIVGCGYHVYKWDADKEGGRAPNKNALGLDFRTQVPPMQTCMTPAMTNVLTDKDGTRHNVMIVPDAQCVVNKGLSSTRGGKMASYYYNADGLTKERLLSPRIYYGDQWLDLSWEYALQVYAGLTKKILDKDGPEAVMFSVFDHGGAGGGFENTWGTGKLIFSAIQTPTVRIHNRPAYNSECFGNRDMGIFELNNSYEDAEVADVIWSNGNNPYESQTNYFLAHWLPNLQGATLDKKKKMFPNEPVEAGKFIFVDPRRTPSIAISENVAAKQVLHLDLQPGTDTALWNGLLTYVVDQGWIDRDFIDKHTEGFEAVVAANRMSLDECSKITGLSVTKIKQAAEWSYKPKAPGKAPRSMHAFEKGVIWGNDNYRIEQAMGAVVLATHNVGRRGTGWVRMGGHQEGYARPAYPEPKSRFPASSTPIPSHDKLVEVDDYVIAGKGRMLTYWASNNFQTSNNSQGLREAVLRRTQIVKQAMTKARGASPAEMVEVIYDATSRGGLFLTAINIYPTMLAQAAQMLLPGAIPGEMNLTSMNGERRIRLSEQFIAPPGEAMPDCLIAARIAQTIAAMYRAEGNQKMAERFAGFDWKTPEDAFNDGFRRAGQPGAEHIDSQGGPTGHLVTYELLRKAGTNGVQLPVQSVTNGKMLGTEMLYLDSKFDTPNGKAKFFSAPWNGLLKTAEKQKDKHRFWINSGRLNEVWQTAYNNQYDPFIMQRYPMAVLQMNTKDMQSLNISPTDVVEVYNDFGTTLAMAYPADELKAGHTFMLFGYVNGIAGDVTTTATDAHFIPWYKGAWGSIKRVGSMPEYERTVSTKSRYFIS